MTVQKKWLPLSPGDSVHMIAPGMPYDRELLKASKAILLSWGLQLDQPRDILGRHPINANSRKSRSDFIAQAIESQSKVIWAARGGYGSLHLLERLKKIKPPRQPKLLIGFSDITTLHQFFSQEWGWPVLHGPHIDRLSQLNSARISEIKKIIFGKSDEVIFKSLKPLNLLARKNKTITGSICGGNLITTQSTFGTPWQIDTKGKIIFLEDIGERGYRVDRVLEHMRLLKLFDKARAVVFGPFVGGKEPNGVNKVPGVLKEFAAAVNVPVFEGLYSGHVPHSRALPMNTPARLQMSAGKATLCVETGCSGE